ncbi:MAG: hypothetical protein WC466_03615 [Candidatus Izemoplasmatales bacterium]
MRDSASPERQEGQSVAAAHHSARIGAGIGIPPSLPPSLELRRARKLRTDKGRDNF